MLRSTPRPAGCAPGGRGAAALTSVASRPWASRGPQVTSHKASLSRTPGSPREAQALLSSGVAPDPAEGCPKAPLPPAGPPQLPLQVSLTVIQSGLLEWGLSFWVETAASQQAGTAGPQWKAGALQLSSRLLPAGEEPGQAPPPSWANSRQKVNMWQVLAAGFCLPHLGEQQSLLKAHCAPGSSLCLHMCHLTASP